MRYGHDPLRNNRQHVVMMSRTGSSTIISYDEVTTLTDPTNELNQFTELQTYITNYQEDYGLDDDTPLLRGRRQLSVEDRFHAHIREKKIRGFPQINLPDFSAFSADRSTTRRMAGNDDGQDDYTFDDDFSADLEDDDEVTVDTDNGDILVVETTSFHAIGLVYIGDNYTLSAEDGTIDNSTFYEVDLGGQISHLPAEIDPEDADLSNAIEPLAVFNGLDIYTEDGLILWPSAGDDISIDEFDDVEIVHRSQLKFLMDSAQVNNTADGNSTDRRTLSEVEEMESYLSPRQLARKEKLAAEIRQLTSAFEAMHTQMKHIRSLNGSDFNSAAEWQGESSERNLAIGANEIVWLTNYATRLAKEGHTMDKSKYQAKFAAYQRKMARQAAADAFFNVDSSIPGVSSLQFDGTKYYQYSDLYSNMNGECQDLRQEVLRFYDHVQYFTLDVQEDLHTVGSKIHGDISKFEAFQGALEILKMLDDIINPVMPALSKIPYIGIVLKVFFTVFHALVTFPVKPLNTLSEKIVNKLKSHKSRLEDFLNLNLIIANKVLIAESKAFGVAEGVLLVDAVCPDDVGHVSVSICNGIYPTLSTSNNQLTTARNSVNTLTTFLESQVATVTDKASYFVESKVWETAEGFINVVSSALTTITNFLNKKYTTCIPQYAPKKFTGYTTITYPIGTKICKKKIFGKKIKYPCGTIYGTKRLPYYYYLVVRVADKCWSYSVQSIITGAMSGLAFVEDALQAAVEAGAKALGISMPTIKLPGMPSPTELEAVVGSFDDYMNAFEFPIDLDDQLDAIASTFENYADDLPACA